MTLSLNFFTLCCSWSQFPWEEIRSCLFYGLSFPTFGNIYEPGLWIWGWGQYQFSPWTPIVRAEHLLGRAMTWSPLVLPFLTLNHCLRNQGLSFQRTAILSMLQVDPPFHKRGLRCEEILYISTTLSRVVQQQVAVSILFLSERKPSESWKRRESRVRECSNLGWSLFHASLGGGRDRKVLVQISQTLSFLTEFSCIFWCFFIWCVFILISEGSKIPKYSFHQFHWEADQRSASNYHIGSKYAELRCFKVESC